MTRGWTSDFYSTCYTNSYPINMLTRVKLLLWMGGTHKPTKCLHANIIKRDHLELIQYFYGLTEPWSDPVNERVSNVACERIIFSSYMYLHSWDRVVSIVTGLQVGWSEDKLLAQARDFLRNVHFWARMQWVVVITYWFDVFLTVHHIIKLFHLPTLMHNSLFIKNMYVTLLSSTCFQH